jgi:hypothetical protein
MVEALLFQEVAVIDEDLGVPEELPAASSRGVR